MTRYYAVVRFNTMEFEADSVDGADDMLHGLIEQLGDVPTKIGWSDVDWVLYEEREGH